MKPQVEDVEDDLAAEEENKLINEVSERVLYPVDDCKAIYANPNATFRNTKFGEDYAR